MDFKKVSIIGLGLIGSSLARCLKQSGRIETIIGVDNDSFTSNYAMEHGFVDQVNNSPDESLYDSDIVVISTHVDSIYNIASGLSVSENTLVTDVGSVKEKIINDINSNCRFHYIGSHPIAGSERSGITNSYSDLFAGKICVITPNRFNRPEDISKIIKFWNIAGSRVIQMEPQIHDRVFAYVSHLPHAVAFSLINTFLNNKDYMQYAGGGLKDFTRIAHSSPDMWTEIFLMNKPYLLEALKYYKESLDELINIVDKDDRDSLKKYLAETVGITSPDLK